MAIRRTREEKQTAQIRRDSALTYNWQSSGVTANKMPRSKTEAGSPTVPTASQVQAHAVKILGYEPKYIYQDLLKTVVITAVCISLLVAIKVWLF